MSRFVHNLRGSFLVKNEVDGEKTAEYVRAASYWGPQKTNTYGGVLAHDGTSVRRLQKGDEGWLPMRERVNVSDDSLHNLPDVGSKVLPRAEAAKLITSPNYEG